MMPPPGTERLPSVEKDKQSYVVQKRIMVSGDTLVDAQPTFQDAEPVVSFKFDSIGAKRFGEATRANVGKLFAIVLDNKVISAPVIREAILGEVASYRGKLHDPICARSGAFASGGGFASADQNS